MSLVEELARLDYLELFLRSGTKQVDQLWGRPYGPEQLEALALAPSAAWQPRFLAAEILFRKRTEFPGQAQRLVLAPVYGEALRAASMGNPWGLPGQLDGPCAQHLVRLGEPVIASLIQLLDDDRLVPYWGSQEATLGNHYAFRVKDFAAYFLATIRGDPYVLHADPSLRDVNIQALKDGLSHP